MLILSSYVALVITQQGANKVEPVVKLEPMAIWQKLADRVSKAKGLTYEVQCSRIKGGVEKKTEFIKVRAMRPNWVIAESDQQCVYANGKDYFDFLPRAKIYSKRQIDPTGVWLPSGSGLLSFCAPSVFKPSYARASEAIFLGQKVVCIEHDEEMVPGLVAKIFINPKTWLPVGWEQGTADSIDRGFYSKIDTDTIHPASLFTWTPPSDAVDDAKVKRVSKLLALNTPAPLLNFKDPDGRNISMSKMLKGKKGLLLSFWFYGCGWCQKEMPMVQKLYTEAKQKGLEVILVNRGDDSLNVIKKFLKTTKYTMPVAANGGDAVKAYGVEAFPTNYLLDSSGKVVYRQSGYGEDLFEEMSAVVKGLGIGLK
jgi:peroxiredoxin/outer membrane lipoprotein-sorting protein